MDDAECNPEQLLVLKLHESGGKVGWMSRVNKWDGQVGWISGERVCGSFFVGNFIFIFQAVVQVIKRRINTKKRKKIVVDI